MLKIQPENLEIANMYIELGASDKVATRLRVPKIKVDEILDKPEVKRYIDNVYLETGYRNRFRIAEVLDEMIENKINTTGVTSEKDLLDLLKFAHQLRTQEQKVEKQTNVQINEFGPGSNYSDLIKRLTS